MILNRKVFFDNVRQSLFSGKLSVGQVAGMEVLLEEAKRLGWIDTRHLAYLFATTYHETARTMQPISERGGDAYFFRMYDKDGDRPRVAQTLGNTELGDGVKFKGRGFVQITGRRNYTDWSKRLNLDLVSNPDLANNPEVAAVIIFLGMEKGTFTGKRLSNYFNDTTTDPFNARRIVNRLDKAAEIESYYHKFKDAIDKSVDTDTTTVTVEKDFSELEKRLMVVEEALREIKLTLERLF